MVSVTRDYISASLNIVLLTPIQKKSYPESGSIKRKILSLTLSMEDGIISSHYNR